MLIHKYEFVEGEFVDMPQGARILHVGTQKSERLYGNEGVFVWALVDPEAPPARRLVVAYGTGHGMHRAATAAKYIGTVQFTTMPKVDHMFDLGEVDDDGMPISEN